jgi:hypothetical protein
MGESTVYRGGTSCGSRERVLKESANIGLLDANTEKERWGVVGLHVICCCDDSTTTTIEFDPVDALNSLRSLEQLPNNDTTANRVAITAMATMTGEPTLSSSTVDGYLNSALGDTLGVDYASVFSESDLEAIKRAAKRLIADTVTPFCEQNRCRFYGARPGVRATKVGFRTGRHLWGD